VARGGVHREAGRLVDDEQISILVAHIQGNGLGVDRERVGRRAQDLHPLAGAKPDGSLSGTAFDEHCAAAGQIGRARASVLGEAVGHHNVEAAPVIVRRRLKTGASAAARIRRVGHPLRTAS